MMEWLLLIVKSALSGKYTALARRVATEIHGKGWAVSNVSSYRVWRI